MHYPDKLLVIIRPHYGSDTRNLGRSASIYR